MNEASREGNPAFHRRCRGTPQWKAHIICVPITLPQHRSDHRGACANARVAHANNEKVPAQNGNSRGVDQPTRAPSNERSSRLPRRRGPAGKHLPHRQPISALSGIARPVQASRAEGTPSLNPNVSCSSQKQGAGPAGHGNRRGEPVALRPRSLDAQTRAPESRSAPRLLRSSTERATRTEARARSLRNAALARTLGFTRASTRLRVPEPRESGRQRDCWFLAWGSLVPPRRVHVEPAIE